MTDLHTHILFGIDDGSKSFEMSIEILDAMKKQGCTKFVFTPHFNFDIAVTEYREKVNAAVAQLEPYLLANNFQWKVGSEVNLSLRLLPQELAFLALGDTRYIMIELPYSEEISESLFNKIRHIIDYNNLTPIIAHIERYPYIIANPEVAYNLKKLGCILQLNGNSLFNKRTAKLAKALIKNNLIDIVCSDVHNTTTRAYNADETHKFISQKFGKELWARFETNADKIFDGKVIDATSYTKVSKVLGFYF